MEKKCAKCEINLDISEFNKDKTKKDGYCSRCKSCLRKYYKNNKKRILEYRVEYSIKNPNYQKEYRNANLIKEKSRMAEWRIKNPDYFKIYVKERCKTDSMFKLKERIRTLIRSSFKLKGVRKNSKTIQILGCSFEQFKQHLESKFEPWMNWDNYGLYNGSEGYGWDIDHIIPLSSAKTEVDIIKLNHYTNLQPLCSKVNRDIKRGTYE
jgi:hypothetical protein